MAQRITRLTTDQKIPGSNPGKLVHIFCAVQSLDLAFLAVIEQVQQIESVVIERQQREKVYCVQLSVIHARSLTAVTDLKRHGLFYLFMSDILAALQACNAYVPSLMYRS